VSRHPILDDQVTPSDAITLSASNCSAPCLSIVALNQGRPYSFSLFLDEPISPLAFDCAPTRISALSSPLAKLVVHLPHNDHAAAQIDTGACVSCTDQRPWLHDFTAFSIDNPCPVRLLPATIGSDAVPQGVGFLHVPAETPSGFLAVRTFYTPALRTTVIDERDFIHASSLPLSSISSTTLVSRFLNNSFTFRARHIRDPALDVVLHGTLKSHKAYTSPLLLPDHCDPPTILSIQERSAILPICTAPTAHALAAADSAFDAMPHTYHQVFALTQSTERLLWHQRLGHPSDHYLYNAHRHILGVPKFKHMDQVLDACPVCIRSKQTKSAAGPNSTRTATVPFQGLSIDFSFAGTHSANLSRAADFVGFNGETCWILIADHFSRFKIGATRISKAAPLDWLRLFLKEHAPTCPSKYVHMDQGGELYANPRVLSLFAEFGYEVPHRRRCLPSKRSRRAWPSFYRQRNTSHPYWW
jgi:GAG-pre-integrase domain